ncbi:class I SAM-dependent methyltransferase [Agromyces sp. NPDC057865]|uniref:class I SAM-dependent methyltransferase n=1 Tax=Agromyces sp. NPDC057865 TaxID=3346267 RepID=UPI003670E555
MTMIDGTHGVPARADVHSSWLGPASYWQPAHIVTSAWLEHAPFGFWLFDELRPRSVVELGTHFGFSFFVFAEAARRLGLASELFALDSWEGDDQAGFYEEDVYEAVRTIAERDYPESTHLLRGYFSESRHAIADDSVDVLHIDGRHGYEDAREDYQEWRSTVRDGGVILFHDIAEHGEGFGVWRLWDELAPRHPSFAFAHGHGLGVLGVGETRSRGLAALFDANEATAREIRSTYSRLGAVVTRQAQLEAMPAEVDSLHALVDSLRHEVERTRDIVSQREAVIDDFRTSTSWKVTRPLRAVSSLLGRGRREAARPGDPR